MNTSWVRHLGQVLRSPRLGLKLDEKATLVSHSGQVLLTIRPPYTDLLIVPQIKSTALPKPPCASSVHVLFWWLLSPSEHRCDARKCTSVLENVPENNLSDTITVLKSR
jgi:hypothetical protein